MTKTLIFTATYNEINNIKKLINKIYKINKNLDILVIDDNSPDGTATAIKNLKLKYKNLKLIIRKSKLGLDTAHKKAFSYAKKKKYLNLITMDADLSHDPREIPKIINLLKNNSFVLGSRYISGGRCEMPISRLMLSIIGNKIIKLILGVNCSEFTTSYRGFNLAKLKKFNMNSIRSKGYSFFMECIYQINKNYKIKEIPIFFRNRMHGKSKIPKEEIFRTLKNLFILKYF